MMRSLVVGGNGFLGSHLVNRLAASGDQVTVFDRFSSGTTGFRTEPRVTTLVGDFLSASDLEGAVEGHDRVFHFVSSTTPATIDNQPAADHRANVVPTIALLDACVDASVAAVYFASSGGAVYGDSAVERHAETDALRPVSPYGIGKMTIENELRRYRERFGLEHITFRIANAYGPGRFSDRGQGLIPIALRRIAAGEPVIQYGDGSMVRDYIYVDDLVDMIAQVADASPQHRVYNMGSGEGVTVRQVIECIARVTGRAFDVVTAPAPTPRVRRAVLDTSRFTREFGARRLTDLEAGIRATWSSLVS